MKHPLRPALAVVAVLLLVSIDHGLPHRYVPDDTVVRCALGMASDAAEGGGLKALVPPSSKYTTYPYLLPYLNLGALGARYVVGRVTGEWAGAGEFGEAVFANPGLAWLPGRLLSVLLALLLPLGVYRAARELGRPRDEAALAALLAGSSLMFVQYAHTTRPWAPTLGFGGMGLALSLRLLRKRRARDVMAAFGCTALAGATFQVGLLFMAVPVVAWGVALIRDRQRALGRTMGRELLGLAAGVLASAAVLACLGFPYSWVHGAASGEGHTRIGVVQGDIAADTFVDVGGQAFNMSLFGGARFSPVLTSWLGYDPVLVVAGLLGLVFWAKRRPSLPGWCLVILPALLFSAIFLVYDGTHVRYLMGAIPFLALGAGRLLKRMVVAGGLPGKVLALMALAVPLVQAGRLDQLLAREDTRTAAARELVDLLGPGDYAAVDGLGSRYGPPLVATAASLQRLMEDQGARAVDDGQRAQIWLTRTEQRRLAEHQAGLPEPDEARALLPLQRYWRFISYYPTDFLFGEAPIAQELGDFLAELGVTHYVRVDRSPGVEPRAPVDAFVNLHGELLWELSPTGRSEPSEAELPTDLGFALTQLWQYERPGPWIRVWRLVAPGG